jgi:hypothetical protein
MRFVAKADRKGADARRISQGVSSSILPRNATLQMPFAAALSGSPL